MNYHAKSKLNAVGYRWLCANTFFRENFHVRATVKEFQPLRLHSGDHWLCLFLDSPLRSNIQGKVRRPRVRLVRNSIFLSFARSKQDQQRSRDRRIIFLDQLGFTASERVIADKRRDIFVGDECKLGLVLDERSIVLK